MGITTKSIPFFSDEIKINPHSATYANDLRPITIREFANGRPVKVELADNNDFFISVGTYPDIEFICGPEVY